MFFDEWRFFDNPNREMVSYPDEIQTLDISVARQRLSPGQYPDKGPIEQLGVTCNFEAMHGELKVN